MALLTRRRFACHLLRGLTLLVPAPPVTRFGPAMSSAEASVPIEPGRLAGDRPAGLFYRVEAAAGPRRVDTQTWLFLPGQRVSRVYPYGGAFDPTRCGPDTCGSYQIAVAQLAVRWDGGRVLQWAFAAGADGISLDGAVYRPARPMTGAALVGRWADAGDGGSNVYTFDGAARFTFGTGQRGLPGAYQLQGFALTLTFADGDVRRRTLFAASAGEPVGTISVEGEVYTRT
jgi:hypothetical protein